MKQPAHTITISPWRGLGFGERMALDGVTAMLWPLQSEARLTVLLNLMAAQIDDMAADPDQVDAIIDTLRMTLKLSRHASPPLQNY